MAVSTVSRMIQNLATAPEDPKLRSIRVSNKAFQSKVAAVSGGAELLVAAGYAYRSCSTTSSVVSVTASAASLAPATSAAKVSSSGAEVLQGNESGNGEGEKELFLVHDMDTAGRGKLHYTLGRYGTLNIV